MQSSTRFDNISSAGSGFGSAQPIHARLSGFRYMITDDAMRANSSPSGLKEVWGRAAVRGCGFAATSPPIDVHAFSVACIRKHPNVPNACMRAAVSQCMATKRTRSTKGSLVSYVLFVPICALCGHPLRVCKLKPFRLERGLGARRGPGVRLRRDLPPYRCSRFQRGTNGHHLRVPRRDASSD